MTQLLWLKLPLARPYWTAVATSPPRAHPPCACCILCKMEAHILYWNLDLTMSWLSWLCFGHTQPGQPPSNQSCSSHINAEKSSTQPVQLAHMVLPCDLVSGGSAENHSQHRQLPHYQSFSFHIDREVPHSQGSYHGPIWLYNRIEDRAQVDVLNSTDRHMYIHWNWSLMLKANYTRNRLYWASRWSRFQTPSRERLVYSQDSSSLS